MLEKSESHSRQKASHIFPLPPPTVNPTLSTVLNNKLIRTPKLDIFDIAQNSRMRTILLTILLFLSWLSLPVPIAGDCGPMTSFQGYSFINPYIVRLNPNLAQFFLDFDVLSTTVPPPSQTQALGNIEEWWERFCRIPDKADVASLIYQSRIDDLQELRSAISSENVPITYLRPEIANNTFAKYLHRHKCTETLDYLIFAKRCEPHVTVKKRWDDTPMDRTGMRDLIRLGKEAFLETESHYFRLRYAYQIIRLAHYLKDYEETLALYDFLMPKIDNDPSILEYWIEGHRAGAMMSLGQRVEASYIFSRIFEKCPSKRESAYRSFDIRTDEEWQQLNLLCANDHERAVLHILRANGENSRLIEEMWNVYNYEPGNRQLEYLALRELQRLEKDLLGLDFNDHRQLNKRYFGIPRAIAGERVIELQSFVRNILEQGQIARPEFWKLLEGYLELLAGDYYFARQTFDDLAETISNDTIEHQLNVWETVLQILELHPPIEEAELEASKIYNSKIYPQYPDMADFMRDRFTQLYKSNGSVGKSFISQYTLEDLQLHPQMDVIDDLLRIIRKPQRNRFEKSMVEKPDGTTIAPELLDLKSSLLLSQNLPEAAVETLKGMDRSDWDNLDPTLYAPFVDRINDCINCILPDSLTQFNKGELIEELLDMEYRARAEESRNRAAYLYYRMGLAYYNMTYFGPAWQIIDEFRSGSSLKRHRQGSEDLVIPTIMSEQGNLEFMNCSRARYLFQRARILADNKELSARATFMEAKCEQNEFYVYGTPGTAQPHAAFDILIDNFADTQFFLQAVQECRYFQAYVTK